MFFARATLLAALTTLASVVTAQQNPFNVPPGGYSLSAGSSIPLSWKPTTGGSVSLVLRSGDATDLKEGTLIADNIANSGSYTWSIPSSITKGAAYTIQIVAGEDVNYTPYFPIDSPIVAPTKTAIVATGAPSGGSNAPPAVPEDVKAAQASITAGQPQATETGNAANKVGGVGAMGALVVAVVGGVVVL